MDQNLSDSSSDAANEEFWDLANSSSDEELMNLEIAALQEKGRRRRWGSIPGRIYKDGALDGGLDIPHSDKRFAGFSKDNKQLDAEVHRKYIYGGHVAAYMRTLMEDEPEKYQSHFSEYIKKGIVADNIEEIYKKVHAAIRADPAMKKSEKPQHSEHKSIISIVSLN